MKQDKSTILKCFCGCCSVVFERWDFDGIISTDYSISFQNSNLVSGHNSLFQRMRDAMRIMFGKPVYYAEVTTEKAKDILDFLNEAIRIVKENT